MSTLFPRPVLFLFLCLAALFVGAPSLAHAQTTFTVTSTADAGDFDTGDGVCDTDDSAGDGPCTLRAAIEQANATANVDGSTPDRIEFDIPGSGPHVIEPTSSTPDVDEAVVIDGTTEPDYSGTPVVVLDGAPNDRNFWLFIRGNGSTVRGLAVVGFNNQAINLGGGGGHTVAACYVGMRPDGSTPGNSGVGIVISGDSVDNLIGGSSTADRNIITGNGDAGIEGSGRRFNPVEVLDGTVIQNNWIGLAPNGTTGAGNGNSGIALAGPGDDVQVIDNVIADNDGSGIDATRLTDAVVQGNRIGTTADGTTARGNEEFALQCSDCVNLQVGGTGTNEGNLIGVGFVRLIGSLVEVSGVVIEGNIIGLDAAGTAEAADGFGGGINLSGDVDSPRIGGSTDAARNVIANTSGGSGFSTSDAAISLDSHSNFSGVVQPGDDALIENNYVGLDVSGILARPATNKGIEIRGGDGHQVIDNVVVSEGEDGIKFRGPDDAVVQGNRIGTRADGTGQLGGVDTGISCSLGENATIGGPGPGEGNRIVGSDRDGLSMGCTSSTVQGNVIGRTADGTPAGAGRDGIYVRPIPTSNITIGGTASGAPNVIAGSGRNGITLEKANVTGNIQWPDSVTIRRNVITESEQVGIDMDASIAQDINNRDLVDGETPNDAGDDDTDAPNNLQNFPEFSRLDYDAGANTVTVEYEVDTAPANATYPLTVDLYRTGPYGQADAYLGSVTIAEASAQTLQTETFTAEAPLARQDFVVATVTTDDGRTSEINPLTQTVTVTEDVLQTYAFDYLDIRVDAVGPDNSSAPLTIRHELRDPENGPPSGKALAIAGSWAPMTNGSVSLNTLCLPLDDLINEPVEVNESALTVYSRSSASDPWLERTTQLETIDGSDYVCGNGPLNNEYIVAADPSELPVELSGFDARRDAETVRLAWQTASETNNAGFHVERLDRSGWQSLGFVEGRGTTESAQTYRFTDRRLPFASDSLSYRLRQVDLDGTATLTDPVVVRLGEPDRLELFAPYPNPARGAATLRYALPTATEARIEVYNVLGQRVATLASGPQAAGRVEQTLDTSRLPSGTYFVRLLADGKVQTQRLTVVQ